MGRIGYMLLAVCLSAFLAIAGCSKANKLTEANGLPIMKELTAEEILEKSLKASQDITSYEFELKVDFNMGLPKSWLSEEEAAGLLAMLEDIEIFVQGAYQLEPMQTELTINVLLKGEEDLEFSVPVIITDEKMWVKLTEIPYVGEFMPSETKDKFMEIDLKQLAELDESLATMESPPNIDKQIELQREIFRIVAKHFDGEEHLLVSKANAANLPADVKAEHMITLTITKDNLEQAVTTFLKALPEILDVLEKPEYVDLVPWSAAELTQFRAELEENQAKMKEGLDELLREGWQIKELSISSAVDSNYHIPYQEIKAELDLPIEEEKVNIVVLITNLTSKINQSVKFKYELPSAEDSFSMDEMFGGLLMNPYADFELDDSDFDLEDFDLEGFNFEEFEDFNLEDLNLDDLD